MPVSYAVKEKAVTLRDPIEPQSLKVVARMLDEGEVLHLGVARIDLQILKSLNLSFLKSIDIGGLPCFDLSFLSTIRKLESLRLSYSAIPQIGKQVRLNTIPTNENLKNLTIAGVKNLRSLPLFPNLSKLSIRGVAENLSFLAAYPLLKDLSISLSSLGGIQQVLHCPNLVRLCMIQISKVDFTDIVTDGTSNNSLKILEISHCRDLVKFDFLKQFPALKYMDITSCRNISSFEGINNCKNLDVVNISECRVRDKNLKYLLHINNVLIGMVYGKEEVANFAKDFKGKIYRINRIEKGYLNYGDFYTKYYGGKIDELPAL